MTGIISSQLHFILLKDENRTKKSLKSSHAPAVTPFLGTLCFSHSSSRRVLRQTALKSRCTKRHGVCIPNLLLSDPHPFPGDSVFISIKTQNHFFFFLLYQFLKPGRVSAWRGTLQPNSELGKQSQKCIPIAYPSPWYISRLLPRESLP